MYIVNRFGFRTRPQQGRLIKKLLFVCKPVNPLGLEMCYNIFLINISTWYLAE